MMTPNSLERASQGFRRGYRDGYAGCLDNPYDPYTFAFHDWQDGRDAALIELKYDLKRKQET